MHYSLLFYETPEEFSRRTDPEKREAYLAGWAHYVHAIREAGIVVASAALHPPETGASLKRVQGEMLVQDGPISATKEQLGGLFVIDVPDQDTALEWAARGPTDAVEVRQNLPPIR